MAFANALALIGPQIMSGIMPQQEGMQLPGGGLPPLQQAKKGGFASVIDKLGQISDAITASRGGRPVYTPFMEARQANERKEQTQNALNEWLMNPDDQAAFMAYLARDPERALQIRKGLTGSQGEAFTLGEGQARYGPEGKLIAERAGSPDLPSFVRELQALGVDPRSPQALELFYGKNSPAGYLLRPPEGGGDIPTARTPEEATALGPGATWRAPDGSVRRNPGGAGGNASGTFR